MKNIYLIGFMGTGKSTVGKILAKDLGAEFVDTDKMVEGQTGKTISQIFEESSEEEFRRLESGVLREITERDNLVVSTGGGIVVTRGNLELMKETGLVVTLIADVQTIMDRVGADGAKRPLLDVDEPFEEIKKLLYDRASFYINAHHIVETSDISAREAADQIIDFAKKA